MRIRFDRRSLEKALTRAGFYISNFSEYAVPNALYRWAFMKRMKALTDEERKEAEERAAYYAKGNSVIMKLNRHRHFHFINDKRAFEDKEFGVVFRNVVRQPQREALLERWFGDPHCDLGAINADAKRSEWIKPYLSMEEQLKKQFVLCIEGNDVATNLKWVMSSNSIAVMPKPKIESWYLESQLIENVHYIAVKEDYSDLLERLEYYAAHPAEANEIIRNAHEHVRRFKNQRLEDYTSYLTA